jgi:hypothetical protein
VSKAAMGHVGCHLASTQKQLGFRLNTIYLYNYIVSAEPYKSAIAILSGSVRLKSIIHHPKP